MPVDRTLAEDLSHNLIELYSRLEQQIVADLARRLRSGIKAPDWAAAKLSAITDLRRAVEQQLAKLQADTEGIIEQTVVLAHARGSVAALDELVRAGYLTAAQAAAIRVDLPGAEAINRLVWSMSSTLRGTHLRVLRWSLDVYRDVISTTALTPVLAGTTTRLAAAQHAWEEFLSRGVTGFVDKSGRRWQLASYVEMATRTGVAQAAVEGHLDRLASLGVDLVIVSDAPQECKRCRPWEGKVLSRTQSGHHTIEVQHATIDDRMVSVEVAGSVIQAVADGLLHPNCRHSLSAYLPGITKRPTNTQDPKGDEARQKLRALERQVRKAKTQAAGALSPADARAHEARVRQLQGQIREHIRTAPTTLFRQRHREQIGAAR